MTLAKPTLTLAAGAALLLFAWSAFVISVRHAPVAVQWSNSNVQLAEGLAARERLRSFHAIVDRGTRTAEAATEFYRAHLASRADSVALSADELRTGGRVTREALVGMAAITGALETEFGNSVTSTDVVMLRSRVQRINSSLIILNAFFESYALSGAADAVVALRARSDWLAPEAADALCVELRAAVDRADANALQAQSQSATSELAAWQMFRRFLWVMQAALFLGAASMTVDLWRHAQAWEWRGVRFSNQSRRSPFAYAGSGFLSRGVTSLMLPSCPGLGPVQTCPHVPQRK
jgi:hypothetical protein